MFQSALHLYQLGEMAGAIISADQGSPSVYHSKAAGTGVVRSLGLTDYLPPLHYQDGGEM